MTHVVVPPSSLAWPVLLAALRRTARRLRELTADVGAEVLTARPGPEEWSVSEIVGHMCAVESPYRARLVRITLQDNPYVTAIGCITGDYDPATPMEILLETFGVLRASTVEFLDALAPVARARPAIHAELGSITLRSQVQALLEHDEEHLAQIAKMLGKDTE
jgi:hypothetical protein